MQQLRIRSPVETHKRAKSTLDADRYVVVLSFLTQVPGKRVKRLIQEKFGA
jgi:hypothetical protein